GVDGGNFNHRTALNPSYINVVIEIDGARRPGPNSIDLQAGSRKNQSLRGYGNIQRLEQRRQITSLWIVLELNFTLLYVLLKPSNRICRRSRRIGNGLVFC